MSRKNETRLALHKDTLKRVSKFKNGTGYTYDMLFNIFMDDIERRYGDDLFIAGQEYRKQKREQGQE